VNAPLDRPLEGERPYLWLDATYPKVREGGRIVSAAAEIAVAARDPPVRLRRAVGRLRWPAPARFGR
jgi:Transposase, Mutator family